MSERVEEMTDGAVQRCLNGVGRRKSRSHSGTCRDYAAADDAEGSRQTCPREESHATIPRSFPPERENRNPNRK